MSSALNVEFPDKLQCLFTPKRYKVMYGGRGGAKSWSIARALLLLGTMKPLRILCAREFQGSIKDSVHKLLSDQVDKLGLTAFYEVQQANIKGVNGTEFSFEGIKHNTTKIKSYEGIDICWLEEADNVSEASMDIIVPTIRKEGSEIWLSFNPKKKTDYVYKEFVLGKKENCIAVEINWRDNTWFPEELRLEMEEMREKDYDKYLHIWEGQCVEIVEGAVYAKELRNAKVAGRLTHVPYDPLSPVDVFFDLGMNDSTAMWFAQRVAFENRFIYYYENRQQGIDHYLKVLRDSEYSFSTLWLPHDARAKQLGTGRSIEEIVRAKMPNCKVRIVPKLSLVDGINAARTVFPNCWFDVDNCERGLEALRNYQYEVLPSGDNERITFSNTPRHDWSSHGSDAFRYAAIALREPKREYDVMQALDRPNSVPQVLPSASTIPPSPFLPTNSQGWMK